MRTIAERLKRALETIVVDYSEDAGNDALSELLFQLGAKNVPHGTNRTLHQHLLGTADVLRAWEQPRWIECAGLFHSVYSTEAFRKQLLQRDQRDYLRSKIGTQAERIVHLFSLLRREEFIRMLRERGANRPLDLRFGATPVEENEFLSLEDIYALLVVMLANLAEQARGNDNEPVPWIAHVLELSAFLPSDTIAKPPLLAKNTRLTLDGEKQLIAHYMRALSVFASNATLADKELEQALALYPWLAEPHVWRAFIAAKAGKTEAAQNFLAKAREIFAAWGTAWDKRLEFSQWLAVCDMLEKNNGIHLAKVPTTMVDGPRSLSAALQGRLFDISGSDAPPRLARYIQSFASPAGDARRRVYPALTKKEWHDPAQFPIVRDLEDNFLKIREEIDRIDRKFFHDESEPIGRDGKWDVFLFFEGGKKNAENCAQCPLIASIIEKHNTVRTLAGIAYISRMHPNTHIAAHTGPTNMRLRCHLGIKIPDGDCGLRVGNKTGTWKQGKCIVFDDFFEHEAWNHTSSERIVLIIDIWHPDLTQKEIDMLTGLQRYAFSHAQGFARYWAANAEKRQKAAGEYA